MNRRRARHREWCGATIVWFRQDLRLSDQPALEAAARRGAPVIPLYILDEESAGDHAPGGASRWWLHHSLEALQGALSACGLDLVLRRGDAATVLPAIVEETSAGAVFWNRCYEPYAIRRDARLKSRLRERGIEVRSFNSALLFEPFEVLDEGRPFRVHSPFARACRARLGEVGSPRRAPHGLFGLERGPASERLGDWRLEPGGPDWAHGLRATWQPGEAGAHTRLAAWLETGLEHYGAGGRHRPDRPGTSRLSPHLHFGEIGPRQILNAVRDLPAGGSLERAVGGFLRELIWREFAYHLLFHDPHMTRGALDPAFDRAPWREDPAGLRAWQRGRTGYPFVDAGMRELWLTGWMHNRARMVVASFLTKHLLIDWRLGAAWFWDTLVDADLANNSLGWQWSASTGADPVAYLRIANPALQGAKFDPAGAYVRRFVPELAKLPDAYIHRPFEAPPEVLEGAGVRPGETYPATIVDHRAARRRALQWFESVHGVAAS